MVRIVANDIATYAVASKRAAAATHTATTAPASIVLIAIVAAAPGGLPDLGTTRYSRVNLVPPVKPTPPTITRYA
jgi:hypothetical protein